MVTNHITIEGVTKVTDPSTTRAVTKETASQSNAYSRGPGSSQSQYSRGSYQHSSRDPKQQQHYNRQGPPNRVS